MIINETIKKNAMKTTKQMKTGDEILEIIKNYEKELRETMQENIDRLGHLDTDTQRSIKHWLVIDELLIRLKLNN